MATENISSPLDQLINDEIHEIHVLQTLLRHSKDALAVALAASTVTQTTTDLAPAMRFVQTNIECAARKVDLAELEIQAAMRRTVGGERRKQ